MERQSPVVRIAVLGSYAVGRDEQDHDTRAVLGRLGVEASIESFSSFDARVGEFDADVLDLFVLDCVDHAEATRWLEVVRDVGPPVLVVQRGDDVESALRVFNGGADQCVRVGVDYANALPATALELIHGWQNQREQGKVEQHIRWLEDFNDAIVNQIPAALAVIDGEGRVASVNPEFSRLLGVSAAEAAGEDLAKVCPADLYRAGGLAAMLEATGRSEDVPPREARWTREDGSVQVFDVRSQQLDDDGHVLLVLSDVTETERQAARIGELQRYNANIIQNINSALLVVGPSRKINFANNAAESILGVETGNLVGRRIAEWFRDSESGVNLIVRTLMDGARFKGAETLIVRGDGRTIPIGISCSPLLDASGETLGAVAIFQDLSEVKQLERQAQQSEKMASIGQLAAGVAHEINNPVGFIHANLFQMSEYLDDLSGVWTGLEALQGVIESGASLEEIRSASSELQRVSQEVDLDYVRRDFSKAVSESQEGSERIRHIVKDLRDFSRRDTGQSELADVNECLETTANILWTMAKHVVTLKKDLAELPRIRCYPMQLKQVFMNLLHNACQAIEEKANSAGSEPGMTGEVEVRTSCKDGGIAITIRDSGSGIAPENLDRIFDPFFTTKDVGVGTGLGLSTSYNIIARHGGAISFASEVGKGTTFNIWLPRTVEPQVGNRREMGDEHGK